jgi:hypothetical protein
MKDLEVPSNWNNLPHKDSKISILIHLIIPSPPEQKQKKIEVLMINSVQKYINTITSLFEVHKN